MNHTKTARRLHSLLAKCSGGVVATKSELAELLECNKKTIDRSVSALRADGLIRVEYLHDEETGGQIANRYTAVEPLEEEVRRP